MGQLAEAKARLASAGTEAEQAKMQIDLAERELKEKEPRAKKAEKDGEGLTRELDGARKKKEELVAALAGLNWDEDEENSLLQQKAEVATEMNRLLEVSRFFDSLAPMLVVLTFTVQERDILKSRLAALDFSYSDPTPNFDRSKVKGLVANLIELDESQHKNATALEICAGGKLYNVIVEDEKVASALLSNKNSLKKRVTLLPLNKINGQVISNDVRQISLSGDEIACTNPLTLYDSVLRLRRSLHQTAFAPPSPSSATRTRSPPPCLSSLATLSSATTRRPRTRSPSTRTSSLAPSPSAATSTTRLVRSREGQRRREEGCSLRSRRSRRSRTSLQR